MPSIKPGNESSFNEKAQVENKRKIYSSKNFVIHFEKNSKKLLSASLKTLENLVTFTSQYPNSEIIVKGYTDSHGNDWYNLKLSKDRSEIVKKYLISGAYLKKIETLKI